MSYTYMIQQILTARSISPHPGLNAVKKFPVIWKYAVLSLGTHVSYTTATYISELVSRTSHDLAATVENVLGLT